MTSLILATRNSHKVAEIQSALGKAFRYFTLDDFIAAPLVKEDGETFEANAVKKAATLAKWILNNPRSQAPLQEETPEAEPGPIIVLADDSGLEVDALNGAPGVLSARYAHLGTGIPGNAPDAANNRKLLDELKGVPEEARTARFRCVIAMAPVELHDPLRRTADMIGDALLNRTKIFSGVCEGRILFGGKGKDGFGYDPLFVPTGYKQSFAELGDKIKNQLSHRAQALEQVRRQLVN